jgi:hypothetical protein
MQKRETGVCVFCTTRMTTVSSVQQSIDLVASTSARDCHRLERHGHWRRVLYHLRRACPIRGTR